VGNADAVVRIQRTRRSRGIAGKVVIAMSPGRVRLMPEEAVALARQALMGLGYSADDACIVAEHVLDAALCGYEYSGLPKILNLAEYRAQRPLPQPMRVRHETPMSTVHDGGGENGMLTLHRATDDAIAKALATGFALVGVHNTWMSGRGAFYVERMARAGLVGIHTVSSRPQVAPPGAARAAIGTNPVAFGFPTEDEPLLIDLGTSSLMFTDLALRARRGETLPAGVAIDADGRLTQDPVRALAGAALSFGGHKGFALALAMQALGVLAGSGNDPHDAAGYLIIAMRPDLMMPLDDYRRELSRTLARIKATPRQAGVDEIRLPSERGFRERRRNRVEGIEIDRPVYEALAALARPRA
jgi:LDH2 family malate/lactate/ureidoglycolate dehydrogenase